jgi:CubicO group peptidase (beta-lactamase class C family)
MGETQTPGVSVALIEGGELVAAEGFGVLEAGKPARVTPETIFQVCSISKHVAMVGALRLVQEGRLNLDEDVNRRLKSWQIPPNGGWQPVVTARQLLGHTAGLTQNWYRGYWRDEPAPTLLQVLDGQPPANAPPIRATLLPGSRFRYSGSHYSVLQQLLVDITGTPFPELMRELVLDPLGMHASSYDQAFPETRPALVAVGHYIGAQPVRGGWRVLPELAAAGLWSSAPDLARLAVELQGARQGKPTVFLRADVVDEAFRTGPDAEWGLGVTIQGEADSRTFGHGGDNVGYKCRTLASCDGGDGIVVLTNGDDGSIIVEELLSGIAEQRRSRGLAPLPQPNGQPLRTAHDHVGRYLLGSDFELHVTLDEDGLCLHAHRQPPPRLEAIDASSYVTAPLDLKVTFTAAGLELDGQVALRILPSEPD